jgi:hypothetical protein
MDFVRGEEIEHLDVLFKWFSLSLKKDARKWFTGLINNSINSLDGCIDVFFSR